MGPHRQGLRFDTDDGEASLSDLFRGRSQLLVHHSMFSPNWTEGCPTCSSMAGRSNPFEIVEHARGAAMTTDRRRPAGIVDPARDPGSSYRPGVARLPSRSERP